MVEALDLGYKLYDKKFDVLAYADDVVLISSTQQGIKQQLDTLLSWATWAGISLNANKCATLTVLGKSHSTGTTTLDINGAAIPTLKPKDFYNHLGIPTGFATSWTSSKVTDNVLKELELIHFSKLAPWQKLDAVNTFILPKLTFHLTLGTTAKKKMDSIDRTLKKFAKRWLNLPQRASSEVLYLTYNQGGANFLPLNTFADLAQVSHALHLFQSRDERITSTATSALKTVIKKRIRREPSIQDICTYLNGSLDEEFGLRSHDIRSTWTRLRSATRRLRKLFPLEWTPGDDIPLLTVNGNAIGKNSANNILSGLVRLRHLLNLHNKPDQGKAYKITCASRESNHFMKNGTLGGWDPANEAAIRRLAISRKYATVMKKLMVSDTIRASREIYIQHLNGNNINNFNYQPRTGPRQETQN
ncbi:uncharacterized protein T26G10.4-like [Centruroides vittatus]|uniref:uncharacterized protein T26G10.4-like n=1 Tax=Centruroides vittatus TaxID=120091 RepID=UPI0035100588